MKSFPSFRLATSMDVLSRNNVHVAGSGKTTLVFVHGFGCDQNMWRLLAPSFAERYTTVTLDLVGSGQSDMSAYDHAKYGTLQGYADDLVEVVDRVGAGPSFASAIRSAR